MYRIKGRAQNQVLTTLVINLSLRYSNCNRTHRSNKARVFDPMTEDNGKETKTEIRFRVRPG